MDQNSPTCIKNKVEIPPLPMQDETLAISKCGYQTAKVNNQTNIVLKRTLEKGITRICV